ncbi:MAG: isopeptide-forming domain-containing fimbrial protein [Lachnospiraceae bacterium]|jgi:fimbrial isopeptide formation D2 family protein/LPXTG-motif cell wall-anchored protein|nr:isopeptide-forming domain-containing fimbrial protein [Lachnospiraceae bacterium]
MKRVKKLFALLLAMAMILAMSVTAFATEAGTNPADPTDSVPTTPMGPAEPNQSTYEKPDKDDVATAIVGNVEAGATVTAYRIVEPTYNDNGFTGYQAAKGVILKNILEPTSDEVTGIAADEVLLPNLEQKPLKAQDGATGLTTYTGELGAGYWIVVVTGSAIQEVYNPMLVGIYYSVKGSGDNNALVQGIVDANSDWSLNSQPAYAKSEQPTLDKKITGSTGKDTSDGNESGNDVAIGDTVNFEIDTKIPSYSASYTKVTVKITDTLGKGLTLAEAVGDKPVGNLVVMVNGEEVAAGDDTFTYTPADDKKSFEISFVSAYALAHSGEDVVVTYDAVLGEDAGINFDANTNTAKLEYTNDPNGETNEIEDKTYTYTFGIDASLTGTWEDVTTELIKTGEEIDTVTGGKSPLDGATFTLTNNVTGAVYTTISGKGEVGKDVDADGELLPGVTEVAGMKPGYLKFTGLDAGEYTLKETKAPEGYSLNEKETEVVIEAEYNDDGTLKKYTITVNGEKTSNYVGNYDNGMTITSNPKHENDWSEISDTEEIANTKLSALPSTGGIGTTIFTVAGCLIMIVAAGLFFASRRKTAKSE